MFLGFPSTWYKTWQTEANGIILFVIFSLSFFRSTSQKSFNENAIISCVTLGKVTYGFLSLPMKRRGEVGVEQYTLREC